MSHLAKSLALSVLLSCSGSKTAEPPAAVPVSEPPAAEPGAEPVVNPPPAAPSAEAGSAEAGGAEPGAQAVTKTLFVAEAQADCQGEVPRKCLQVRESESEPYRNLYSNIEGFDYEPSYVYQLRVEASPVANPPADASAVRYRLLEVVSKRKAPSAKTK
jgi:hypothetical protein